MKLSFALSLIAALCSGCIIVPRHAAYRPVVVERCPPNHHWDGYGCRHNGNGYGHRY